MEPITVNGTSIAEAAVLAEMQYHPAKTADEAMRAAAEALVVQELLLQRAAALGFDRQAEDSLDRLLAREVALPEPDEEACRRYFEANRKQFRTPTLYEARHILIAAMPDDEAERREAKALAETLIARLQENPALFSELAQLHSACPSKQAGGHLGQFVSGSTVPEFESFLEALEVGQLSAVPVPSRYGYHALQLLAREPGRDLPYEAVREHVADYLSEAVFRNAVRQYVALLAAEADIRGIVVDAAESPLVQ